VFRRKDKARRIFSGKRKNQDVKPDDNPRPRRLKRSKSGRALN